VTVYASLPPLGAPDNQIGGVWALSQVTHWQITLRCSLPPFLLSCLVMVSAIVLAAVAAAVITFILYASGCDAPLAAGQAHVLVSS
jgi:hypothetical protein